MMKAAELTGLRDLRIQDRPVPHITAPGEVLIRVRVVGVCGSDVHYYTSGRIGDQVVEFPWIVGHETAGTVEKTGGGVTGISPGDRVAVDPVLSCGTCDQCLAGRRHTCRNQRFLGCPGQIEGALCEYIVLPEECCYLIPENLSFEQAALCEPLSIGMYAADLAGLGPDTATVILGSGPIGISVLLSARNRGVGTIFTADPLSYRNSASSDFGASWAGNPEELSGILEARLPEGPAVIFECCGEQEALDQAVGLCSPGGRIMIVGIPEFDRYTFDAHGARRKELEFRHVRRQNDFAGRALEAVSKGDLIPDRMATHHFSLTESGYAFELVDGYKDGVIKAIIHM
jgi:L-iditol 2-dehydrogenase